MNLYTNFDDSMDDEAHLEIDQEINGLQREMLHSKRNMLVPISRLPPELLSRVFLFIRRSKPEYPNVASRYLWVKVSHVCRYWRTVAMECTALWDDIEIAICPAWAEEMILRSKAASIRIKSYFISPGPSVDAATRSVLREIDRARYLKMVSYPHVFKSLLENALDRAPLLEHLTLKVPQHFEQNALHLPWSWDTPSTMPTGFSRSRLRRLNLRNCCIDWDSPLFSGLTHLTLAKIPKTARPTLSQFLDVLERITCLEHLKLHLSLPKADDRVGGTSCHRAIHLPHLSFLILISTTIDCARLVERLSFTPQCEVLINCDSEDGDIIFYERRIWIALVDSYLNVNGTEDINPFKRMSIERDDTTVAIQFRFHANPTPLIFLSFSKIRDSQSSLLALMNATPLSKVDWVCVDLDEACGDLRVGCALWELILPRLVNLRCLKVWGGSDYSLIKVLSRDFVDQILAKRRCDLEGERRPCKYESKSEAPKVHLPQLKRMGIIETRFGYDFCDEGADCFRLLGTLMDFLMLRFEFGAEIQTLTFCDCDGLSSSHITLLEEIVVDVRVQKCFSDDYDEDAVDIL